MNSLKDKYQKQAIKEMKKKFGYKNDFAIPHLSKIVINVGTGKALEDKDYLEIVAKSLAKICGQRPIKTKAEHSISGFKVRKDMVVGLKITLRGRKMYDFFDKLINVAFPRVRDFRGIKQSALDDRGNLNLGFAEQIVFPEIKHEKIERTHGLEVNVINTAKNQKEGKALFELLGCIFQKKS